MKEDMVELIRNEMNNEVRGLLGPNVWARLKGVVVEGEFGRFVVKSRYGLWGWFEEADRLWLGDEEEWLETEEMKTLPPLGFVQNVLVLRGDDVPVKVIEGLEKDKVRGMIQATKQILLVTLKHPHVKYGPSIYIEGEEGDLVEIHRNPTLKETELVWVTDFEDVAVSDWLGKSVVLDETAWKEIGKYALREYKEWLAEDAWITMKYL